MGLLNSVSPYSGNVIGIRYYLSLVFNYWKNTEKRTVKCLWCCAISSEYIPQKFHSGRELFSACVLVYYLVFIEYRFIFDSRNLTLFVFNFQRSEEVLHNIEALLIPPLLKKMYCFSSLLCSGCETNLVKLALWYWPP